MSEKTAYPLCWPDGWKRTASRVRAAFNKKSETGLSRLSVADSVRRVLYELERMGFSDDDIIISTNVQLRLDGLPRSDREPMDPGAAVYWQVDKQHTRCMAIDQYDRVADNLAAIAATLEAMRAIERHGGAAILDRAFKGFLALPQHATQHWREVLGISGPATRELITSRYRALLKLHHPDIGGTDAKFLEITQAREAAELEIA